MAVWNPSANEVFLKALEIPQGEKRVAYLERACADDPELRAAVDALLTAHEDAGNFLDHPALAPRQDETLPKEAGPPADWVGLVLELLPSSEDPRHLGRLGQYEIVEVIGHGGMGIVLKAQEPSLSRVVAVKLLSPHLASNPAARQRFLREAKAAAAVTHPHVVTVHAVDESQRFPCLVMEFVAGESLQQKIERDGTLPPIEILRIGAQVASGLAAAHAHGLIHRDIKPSNILLENGVQRVKITDFGLARAVDDVSITRTGDVTGTPHYMSPEQARGEHTDCRSDLFSLGCVLYATCTGRSPFRAESSMGAMRRVCEDTPRPIHEINPDIPEWLVAIIDRLLAKRPDERFQTAEEVADVLQGCLAHVQHPAAAPLPAIPKARQSAAKPKQTGNKNASRRFALTAAAVFLLLLGVGLTEATGVSEFVPTVVRIVRGEGTLVIEVDDPSVQVSLDGEELRITGAGFQELRLIPGRYRFHAIKDGEPVKDEVVTITRGGRKVMSVTLEHSGRPEAALKGEFGAFVLLGGEGVAERKFDTLEDAVRRSSPGDTIEVRGNGPFTSDGVTVAHPLVLRAGEGFAPSITLSQAAAEKNIPLVSASASLVLEGLELRRVGASKNAERRYPYLVHAWGGGGLHVLNCRLVFNTPRKSGWLILTNAPIYSVRNCELTTDQIGAVGWYCPSRGRGTIENCVNAVGVLDVVFRVPNLAEAAIQLRRNTIVGNCLNLALYQEPLTTAESAAEPLIRVELTDNVTHFGSTLGDPGILRFAVEPALSVGEIEAILPNLVDLSEQRNVYERRSRLLGVRFWKGSANQLTMRGQDLADWNRFWDQQDTGSLEGAVRFQGGDLIHRVWSEGEELHAEDFRLRPDSAGYRAGPDGKDLGADIDLVGPGAAYERWKKTPEYQEWLKETGQQQSVETSAGASALEREIAAWQKIINEKSKDPTAQREVAQAYLKIGARHTHVGRLEDAERALRTAIDLYAPLVSQNRRHLPTRAHEVYLYRSLALARRGPVSLDTLRAALRLAEKLSSDFPGEELSVLHEVDTSLSLLAILGDTPESRALLERSRELADSLGRGKWHPRIDFWQGGFLHNDRRYDDAIAAYRQAIDLHEKRIAEIGAESRESAYERHLLGLTLHHLGISLAAGGRLDDAITAQRRAIETLQPLVDAFPQVRIHRSYLKTICRELAAQLEQLGGHDEEVRRLRDQAARLEDGAAEEIDEADQESLSHSDESRSLTPDS